MKDRPPLLDAYYAQSDQYNIRGHDMLKIYFDELFTFLTLKVPITTAADNKFCDFFPDFWKK